MQDTLDNADNTDSPDEIDTWFQEALDQASDANYTQSAFFYSEYDIDRIKRNIETLIATNPKTYGEALNFALSTLERIPEIKLEELLSSELLKGTHWEDLKKHMRIHEVRFDEYMRSYLELLGGEKLPNIDDIDLSLLVSAFNFVIVAVLGYMQTEDLFVTSAAGVLAFTASFVIAANITNYFQNLKGKN